MEHPSRRNHEALWNLCEPPLLFFLWKLLLSSPAAPWNLLKPLEKPWNLSETSCNPRELLLNPQNLPWSSLEHLWNHLTLKPTEKPKRFNFFLNVLYPPLSRHEASENPLRPPKTFWSLLKHLLKPPIILLNLYWTLKFPQTSGYVLNRLETLFKTTWALFWSSPNTLKRLEPPESPWDFHTLKLRVPLWNPPIASEGFKGILGGPLSAPRK